MKVLGPVPSEVRQWAAPALWARLQAILSGGADALDADAQAAEAMRVLSAYRVAGLDVSVEAIAYVLRAAARAEGEAFILASAKARRRQAGVCELYGLLASALAARGESPPPDICGLVLPHFERAGRWREALALPHAAPSVTCFSHGIDKEANE